MITVIQVRRRGEVCDAVITDDVARRFWRDVDRTPVGPRGCWLWRGGYVSGGYKERVYYPRVLICSGGDRLQIVGTRVAVALDGRVPALNQLVDHMDCVSTMCVRPDHLQVVDRAGNGENRRKINRNSTTGVRGVSFNKNAGKYIVNVWHGGRPYYGGLFVTLAEAEQAAIALRLDLHSNNLMDRAGA